MGYGFVISPSSTGAGPFLQDFFFFLVGGGGGVMEKIIKLSNVILRNIALLSGKSFEHEAFVPTLLGKTHTKICVFLVVEPLGYASSTLDLNGSYFCSSN